MKENNKTDEEKKPYYWLTTSNQSDFQSLKVDSVNRTSLEKHLNDCLWFEDNEKEIAKAFLRDVKIELKKIYEKYGKKATWMTDEWINN